jgi:hypothetical protein
LHLEIDADHCLHLELDIGVYHGLKALYLGAHPVDTWKQRRKAVGACRVRHSLAADICVLIGDGDSHTGHDGAGSVADLSRNLTLGLRVTNGARPEHEQEGN